MTFLFYRLLLLVTALVHCVRGSSEGGDVAEREEPCFSGSLQEIVKACADHNCCTSSTSCFWPNNASVTICADSCQGEYACVFAPESPQLRIATGSCIGEFACQGLYGNSVRVGPGSCRGLQVCQDAQASPIGTGSCHGYRACANTHESIGDQECLQSWACLPGVEEISQLSTFVTRSLLVSMVFVLIVFLHPSAPARPLQQEQLQLTRN
jgi:hypothetical protein